MVPQRKGQTTILVSGSAIFLLLMTSAKASWAGEEPAIFSEGGQAAITLPAVTLTSPSSGHRPASCWQRLWDWLTYHPLRSGSCGWPGIRCVKRPHLYEYLLPCADAQHVPLLHGPVWEWQSEGETLPPPRTLSSDSPTP